MKSSFHILSRFLKFWHHQANVKRCINPPIDVEYAEGVLCCNKNNNDTVIRKVNSLLVFFKLRKIASFLLQRTKLSHACSCILVISTVKITLQLNENNRHTFKKRTKKCKYIWLIKHFYYHILSLCFILTLCMEFCVCYAENQIGLNTCALKAAPNNHSAFLWFSLWAYKRCLQLGCCNRICSEKRVRSSSVFLLSGTQYFYWCNAEGTVQSYDQVILQPCFGVCLYRFITQIMSHCNQVFLFCVPKCGFFVVDGVSFI